MKILLELKLSSASTMNHLIDFGVCALAGCTHFIILHNYFKRMFKVHFWYSNLMLHSKSPIIRRNTKRKVQYYQIVKWAKRVRNCNKLGKCLFSDESSL